MSRHRNQRPARSSAAGRKRRRLIEWVVAIGVAVLGALLALRM